jgi:hypothetical protein
MFYFSADQEVDAQVQAQKGCHANNSNETTAGLLHFAVPGKWLPLLGTPLATIFSLNITFYQPYFTLNQLCRTACRVHAQQPSHPQDKAPSMALRPASRTPLRWPEGERSTTSA